MHSLSAHPSSLVPPRRAFVIAMECEAECVRPWLKPDDRLYVSGIGKVNAAAATMKAICEGATEIWNAGLCGGFGDDIEVGDVFGVSQATEYDFDLAKINGVAIGVLDGFDTPYIAMAKVPGDHSDLRYRILATGDHFNDSESDYDLITKVLCASLRDMEGAAIAHVCKIEGVRCCSVKCVTNVAGKGLMTGQYEENRQRCLARLSEALKGLI